MVTVVEKGDIVELELENLAHGGECVGHLEGGFAVFIPGGVPGDKVKARITKRKKNFLRGKITEIIEPSEFRGDPCCEVFDKCGGCQLQQIDYQGQLIHKRKVVRDSLERIGRFSDIDVNEVIPADYPWQYRNKAQFPLTEDENGEIKTGFYRKGTHQVIENSNCLIQHSLINRIVQKTLEILNEYENFSAYDENNHRGLLRHLLIRVGVCTNQAILTIVTSSDHFPFKNEIASKLLKQVPELIGVLQNINSEKTNVILGHKTKLIKGEKKYVDYIGPIKFEISPVSFFQVNTLQTKKLYDIILKFADLSGQETVVDGYCGIGTIALYLADRVKKVYGIELNRQAIKDAQRNAKINHKENSEFISGKVENILPEFLKEQIEPDLVIFDPPRKGLGEEVIEVLHETKPGKIIYVSCNPSTLARDLKKLSSSYQIDQVQPVDMFPQTYHIETVVQISAT